MVRKPPGLGLVSGGSTWAGSSSGLSQGDRPQGGPGFQVSFFKSSYGLE